MYTPTIPFQHPQFKTCECGITSEQFCKSFPDKPFSLCLKTDASQETAKDKK